MFKNRFILSLAALSMLLVTLAVSQPFSEPSTPVVVPMTGAEDQPYSMDSATRSYIAWGQAMQARNAMDSGTRSYIAWGEASKKRNSMRLIPGRVPTLPGERRWKPQGNWASRAPAQT